MTLTLSFICFQEALPGWRWRRRCCCLDILVDLFKQLGSCRILLIQSFWTATIWILPPFSFLSGCISNNLPHCRASLQGELLATFMHCSYCLLHRLPLRVEPFSGNCIHVNFIYSQWWATYCFNQGKYGTLLKNLSKLLYFHPRWCIRNGRLRNVDRFVAASMC